MLDWDDFFYDNRNKVLAVTEEIEVGKTSLESTILNVSFFKRIKEKKIASAKLLGLPFKFGDHTYKKVKFRKNNIKTYKQRYTGSSNLRIDCMVDYDMDV